MATQVPFSTPLTEEQIEHIAERAAEKAAEKVMKTLTDHMYREVGKGVVSKLFWIIGVISIGLYMWLKQKGLV
jgi:hypothetical protein